jgi:hypothetical protein
MWGERWHLSAVLMCHNSEACQPQPATAAFVEHGAWARGVSSLFLAFFKALFWGKVWVLAASPRSVQYCTLPQWSLFPHFWYGFISLTWYLPSVESPCDLRHTLWYLALLWDHHPQAWALRGPDRPPVPCTCLL